MAETPGIISNTIIVNATQAKQEFETLSRQLREIKVAHEKALSSKSNTTLFKGEQQSAEALQRQIVLLTDSLYKLRNLQNVGIASTKERTNVAADKKYYDDQNRAIKANSDAIKEQMKTDVAYEKYLNGLATKYNRQDAKAAQQAKPQDFATYTQQLRGASTEAERLYQTWKKTGDIQDKLNFTNAAKGFGELSRQSEAFNKALTQSNPTFDGFSRRVKSHLEWMASGLLITGALAIPASYIASLKEIEVGMAGISQVLPTVHGDHAQLNAVFRDFVGISQQYGENVNEVIEAGKLWGRAYKDIPTLMAFTAASAKLAVADNFSLTASNKALEATLAQYEWRANNAAEATAYSMRVVDAWTNVAHNAQVSAQDLASANERTASVAHKVGVEFEFLQAMIAAGVRNTGRSGAEIGNTLKTVFGSIHSAKAVTEIEKIGVATKETTEDGTVKWRKVQDVILDLSIATRATTKDVEGLLKATAGGKFQWAKFSSLLDYDELIKVYGLAVNSAGVTERQIDMQMDTISRKSEQLQATLVGLVTNSGGGVAQIIKDGIDSVTRLVNVLNNISPSVYAAAGSFAHLALFIGAGVRVYQRLAIASGTYTAALAGNTVVQATNTAVNTANSIAIASKTGAIVREVAVSTGSTIATGVNTTATNVNTAAKVRNAVATTVATGGMNLLVAALITAGLSWDLYNTFSDKAADSTDKLGRSLSDVNRIQEETGVKENLAQSLKQRGEFIDDLVIAHAKLTTALSNESEGTKQYEKLQTSLGNTQKELAEVCNVTTADIVQDGVLRMDIINQEKDNNTKKIGDIKEEIKGLKNAQIDYTQQQIQSTQDRIDALASETSAWGVLAQAQQLAMEQYAGALEKQISSKQWIEDKVGRGNIEKVVGERGWDLEGDKTLLASIRNYRPTSVTNEFIDLSARLRDLKLQKAQATISKINYDTTNPGSEINEDDGKKAKDTSKGGVPPTDPSSKIQRDMYKMAQNAMFLESKVSADNYANTLSNLATKEALYGNTVRNTIDGYTAKTQRISDLAEEEKKYSAESEKLEALIDAEIESQGDIQESLGITKAAWDALSKGEKAALRLNNRDILEQHQLTKAQTAAMQGYKEKASEVRKEIVKITDELLKARYAGSFDFMKLSERKVKNIGIDEATAEAKINPRNVMGNFDKVEIQHNAEQQRNREYLAQAEFLKKELEEITEEEIRYYQGLVDSISAQEASEEKTKALAKATLDLKAAQEGNTTTQRSLSDAIKENSKDIEVSNAKLEETKDKYKAIKDEWAKTFADMITSGQSGAEILKNLWKDLANEAIQRMLGVNAQGNLLASTAGKGKGAVQGPRMADGSFTKNAGKGKGIGKHAAGGVFNVPHIAQVAEDGDEAIVNLKRLRSGDARQSEILSYANSQVYKGDTYVPTLKNPQLAQTGTQDIRVQQSAEHIAELSKQTKVLQDMMMLMLQNQGNQGGGTTIVASTVTDAQVLGALSRNPRAVQGISAKNKSNGY